MLIGYTFWTVTLYTTQATFEVYAQNLQHAESIAFGLTTEKIASVVERDVPANGKRSFIMYDINEPGNVSQAEYKRRGVKAAADAEREREDAIRAAQERYVADLQYENTLAEAKFVVKNGYSANILCPGAEQMSLKEAQGIVAEHERRRVATLTPEQVEAEFAAFLKTPDGQDFSYGFDVLYKEELENRQ